MMTYEINFENIFGSCLDRAKNEILGEDVTEPTEFLIPNFL